MSEPFAAALARAFEARNASLVMRAREVLTAAGAQLDWTDDDLRQILTGFAAMVREAAEGTGNSTRELFLDTAVPAAVAQGETPEHLLEMTVTWGVLIATELTAEVPADEREAALAWLAGFFGRYARDVHDAARRAQQEAS